jgi:hypothetical protein
VRIYARCLIFFIASSALLSACKQRTDQSDTLTASRPGEDATTISGDAWNFPAQNPTHYNGPFTTIGKWALNPDSIKTRYKGLDYRRYGTMRVLGPDGNVIKSASGREKFVRDLHYYLGNGAVGLRPFPVAEPSVLSPPSPSDPYVNYDLFTSNPPDEADLTKSKVAKAKLDTNGQIVLTSGNETVTRLNELDDYLMNRLPNDKLQSFWEIFALTTYTHPFDFEGNVLNLPKMKLQGAYSHMGGYFGRGRTRNAPFGYENYKIWSGDPGSEHSAYPVDIVEVRFKNGTSRRITNVNTRIMQTILNGNGQKGITVEFPTGGYEFDFLMLDSIANNLHFFAAWVDPDYPATFVYNGKKVKWVDAIHNELELKTYCSEHLTAALNLGFNLPFNEKSFEKAYGAAYGAKLFDLARKRHKLITGYYPEEQTFKPLYEVNGVNKKAIEITQANVGLVWPLQSTGDFIANLLEQYVAWPDVGAPVTALTVFGLQPETAKRIGIPAKEYFEGYALKIVVQSYVHEAMTKVSATTKLDQYLAQAFGVTDMLFGGAQIDATDLKALVRQALEPMRAQLEGQATPMKPEVAWESYRTAIQPVIDESRKRDLNCPLGTKCVKWYSSPSITHRIAVGIHEANPALAVETVGTLFDPVDLVRIENANEQTTVSYDLQTGKAAVISPAVVAASPQAPVANPATPPATQPATKPVQNPQPATPPRPTAPIGPMGKF